MRTSCRGWRRFVDPDDDGRTREDREAEKAEGRPPAANGGAGMI
jgi:hypothetical protein